MPIPRGVELVDDDALLLSCKAARMLSACVRHVQDVLEGGEQKMALELGRGKGRWLKMLDWIEDGVLMSGKVICGA